MNEDPVARLDLLVFQQADVDDPPDPADIDPGQIGLVRQELDNLTRNPESHGPTP